MESIDGDPIAARLPVTESRIAAFEAQAGAKLPNDYRDFLTEFGGYWVDAKAPIEEPTPFGTIATVESFYGFIDGKPRNCDLQWQCELADGAPVAIPIAGGAFGCQTFIIAQDNPKISVTQGSIYFWDCDGRSSWPDDEFHQRFPSLSPDVKRYLDLRAGGSLPEKHDAMADFYKVADSFTMFMEMLLPCSDA